MAKKLSKEELVAYINRRIDEAQNATSQSTYSSISVQRTNAIKSYYSLPYGNEREGRSQYVGSEVLETIEFLLPQLMEMFYSSPDGVVKFLPSGPGPEQEQLAEDATDYALDTITRKNEGFLLLHNFIKDAFLQKIGVFKLWWEEREETERFIYEDLTDEELTQLAQTPGSEIIEHSENPPADSMPFMSHDVTVRVSREKARICIETIPPEELIVSRNARSPELDKADMVAHVVKRSLSEWRQLGYKVKDDIIDDAQSVIESSLERIQRERIDGIYTDSNADEEDAMGDPSSRRVWGKECYVLMDRDGDGIAELRQVVIIGDQVFEDREVSYQPFVAATPVIMPHKFQGLSVADLIMDLQKYNSMLVRAALDAHNATVNPKRAVDASKIVDPNDLLNANVNWIRTRGNPNEAVAQFDITSDPTASLNLVQYFDDKIERRTGAGKLQQGIDVSTLSGSSRDAQQQIMSMMQAKTAMLMRVIAETGIKPLMKKIVKIGSLYDDPDTHIMKNGEFRQVNPRMFDGLDNLQVMVGVGANDKDRNLQYSQLLLQTMQMIMQAGPMAGMLMGPNQVYAVLSMMVKGMGEKSVNKFFLDPSSPQSQQNMQQMQAMQPPPPPDPQMMLVEVQKEAIQADTKVKTDKALLDKEKSDADNRLAYAKLALDTQIKVLDLAIKAQIASKNSDIQLFNTILTEANQVLSANAAGDVITPAQMTALQALSQSDGGQQQASQGQQPPPDSAEQMPPQDQQQPVPQ